MNNNIIKSENYNLKEVGSVYIHIPFCNTICTYCDFCKFLKNDEWVYKYLEILEQEIKTRYLGEIIHTIYIGGGTPSCLDVEQLNKLFDIIKIFKKSQNIEITFECNIENITEEKLKLLHFNGVNRLSIGIQTFNEKYLEFLNRNHNKQMIINNISIAKKIGFNNINIDLIYALKDQTIRDLEIDLDEFLKLDINHISTYSLIIEPHTNLYINNEISIDEDLDYEMYNTIINKLSMNGYKHYEVSNFAKEGYESKHNLTYWNNLEYYGFGIGASGYINNVRYDNTRSINQYFKGNYIRDSHKLDKKEMLENEFILGLRKIDGINKQDFYNKYGIDIKNINVVRKLLNEKKLLENQNNIYVNPKYIYILNDILIDFID